jgi:hypothetical protein
MNYSLKVFKKNNSVKILLSPIFARHTAQFTKLSNLFEYSDHNKYQLVTDPNVADLILLTDGRFDNKANEIRCNELLKQYTSKCFVLSNEDCPLPLFRGVYASAEKSIYNFNRIRSTSYTDGFDPHKNEFIVNSIRNIDSRDDGGKKYLFSFIGRNSHLIREKIFSMNFSRQDVYIKDSSESFDLYDKNLKDKAEQLRYSEIMKLSKFALCPRGCGANSIRLFEAMQLGVAPVIISDEWILPYGPDWKECSIVISSKNLNSLEKILIEKESSYNIIGKNAQAVYKKYFAPEVYFEYLIKNCLDIKHNQIIPEKLFTYFGRLYFPYLRIKSFISRL